MPLPSLVFISILVPAMSVSSCSYLLSHPTLHQSINLSIDPSISFAFSQPFFSPLMPLVGSLAVPKVCQLRVCCKDPTKGIHFAQIKLRLGVTALGCLLHPLGRVIRVLGHALAQKTQSGHRRL